MSQITWKIEEFLNSKKNISIRKISLEKTDFLNFLKEKKSFQSKSQNNSFQNESQNSVNIIFVNCNILLNSTSSQMIWCEKCHLKKK